MCIRDRPKELPRSFVRFVPDNTNYPFMSWRRYAFGLSAAASIAAAILFFSIEMNYGIDFRGGTSIEVQAKIGAANSGDVRARLSHLNLGEVQVQEFGADNNLMIRVEGQKTSDNAEQSVVEKVHAELANNYDFRRVESVGPTVSNELAWYGTLGVIASMFAMLIYIWFRFEWQFGLGAIIATVHDVTTMVGLYVMTGIEFNLTSIAAILTIVGYSINDTVVVYDRVRENLDKYKRMSIEQLLNLSMNQTLSRTILTGVTTLLALIALYLFGGEVIRSFTLGMIVGVIVGTYSSIFVAGPLLIMFRLRFEGVEAEDKKKSAVPVGARPTKS